MSRSKTLSRTHAQAGKRPKPKSPSAAGPFLAGKKLNAILCILLAAATIALYSPVRGHTFITLDDPDYVTGNFHIHGGLAWSTIKWAFTATAAANWHPLTWLSHALDYQLFALNPAGHHLDSVLIHALNAVVLFLLLAWVTKRVGPSLLVAALFALHPINVESVAWVAERKNVLSALFFFLAIGAYVWYARKPDWRRYLLVAGLFAAGLMAKPIVITLPFVLLLLDYWPLQRTSLDGTPSGPATSNGAPRVAFSSLVLEKVPLLLLSAASAAITVKAQGHAVRSLHQFPPGIRIENAILSYGMYLWKMLWPAWLTFYLYPVNALPAWQWILAALVLISITVLVLTCRRKGYLPVGWFWFLGTLVPVIGLVQVGEAAMADRYVYIPLIGIFVMIAWGLDDWAEAKKVHNVWRIIPALCALAALGCVTHRQISYWDSDYDLWSHTLANGESPLAHNYIGGALLDPALEMTQHDRENVGTEQKRMDDARQHIEAALKTYHQLAQQNPDAYRYYLAVILNNLGSVDQRQNRLDDARQHFEEALRIYRQLAQQDPDTQLPNVAARLNNLGIVDQLQNRLDDARQHYEGALKIYRQLAEQNPDANLPHLAMTLNGLGNLAAIQSRLDDARQHFESALKTYRQLEAQNPGAQLPYMASTLSNLGIVDQLQNRLDDARQHFEESLRIYRQLAQQDPDTQLPSVAARLNNLGIVDQLQNRSDDARAHYQEALTLYRKLSQGDSRYAGGVARVEAALKEMEKEAPSR